MNYEAQRGFDAVSEQYIKRTKRSADLYRRAERRIPGGVSRGIVHFQPHPIYIDHAEGAYVYDVDGNQYLDCIGNYTTMVIGHNNPAVVSAVVDQVAKGSAWSAGSSLEIELADVISSRIPSIEAIKFAASGTEATMLAIRAARAFTGRPLIAKFEGGYHGLHDYAMVSLNPSLENAGPIERPNSVPASGIPSKVAETVLVLPFNNIEAVRQLIRENASELAGVIIEPVQGVAGIIEPKPEFLRELRALTKEVGCLLIFDEVISFRLSYGGAQEFYGVRPDLTTLGKIIGGGYPIGAVGGRRDVMEVFSPTGKGPKVTISGTFHANPISLAAGLATLKLFTSAAIAELNVLALSTMAKLRIEFSKASNRLQINSVGSIFNVHFSAEPVADYRSGVTADKNILQSIYLGLLNEGVMLTPRGMGAFSTAVSKANANTFVDKFRETLAKVL